MSERTLSDRYGRAGNPKRQLNIVIALASLLLVGFLAWAAYFALASSNQIKHRDLSYEILSPTSARVVFEVTRPGGREANCSVQVLNQSFAVVGYKQVKIAPSTNQTEVVEVLVNTTELGVTGLVDACR